LVALLEGLSDKELNWRPPAPGTNSLYVLAYHTLANAGENVLGVLCGQLVERNRSSEFVAAGVSSTAARPVPCRARRHRPRGQGPEGDEGVADPPGAPADGRARPAVGGQHGMKCHIVRRIETPTGEAHLQMFRELPIVPSPGWDASRRERSGP